MSISPRSRKKKQSEQKGNYKAISVLDATLKTKKKDEIKEKTVEKLQTEVKISNLNNY